jgi:hypothetical protein
MRISGATPPLPPVAGHARSTRPAEADASAQAPAPAPTPALADPEAPAETGKPHGLVRAAEHSNRSDVAALRQWINHPDLRDDLPLPDLSAEHKGQGFQKAVAAYKAAGTGVPATDLPPTNDPALVVDRSPIVTDPALGVTEPVARMSDPDPSLDLLSPAASPDDET